MWLLIPFLLQAVIIGIDEVYFHIKRGLPRWERIGHPLDTFTAFACFLFVLLLPYSAAALKWYIGLCIFSCLCVTKDEFIHKHHCPASEQWLHALLFLNHPIMLAALGILWHRGLYTSFLISQTALVFCFMLYQIVYWNFVWKKE